jgi:hypothetical protein
MESIWSWAVPWWATVVGINVINFVVAIVLFYKSKKSEKGKLNKYGRRMRIAGLIFVSVGFYRSIFISSYYKQLAWFDTIFNSTLLIRSFAFFAEISFAVLIMYGLLQINKDLRIPEEHKSNRILYFMETKTPYIFCVLLCIAQIGAYGGAITKIYLLFAIEETLWGLAFLIITPLVLIQLRRVFSYKDVISKKEFKQYRIFTVIMAVFCIGYCSYSLLYHLPVEYWPVAIKQLSGTIPDPDIRIGWSAIKDTLFTVNATRDYIAWGGIGFVIWHSGYFTLCEWMAMFFMTGPRKATVKK